MKTLYRLYREIGHYNPVTAACLAIASGARSGVRAGLRYLSATLDRIAAAV